MADSLIATYLEYNTDTEPPYIFHRWCALTTIAALLGRNYYFQHGHFRVFPNLYTVLVGEAGSRKSTAIKLSKKLISACGYQTLSADKTSKEKFLLDLEGKTPDDEATDKLATKDYDSITAQNLWGTSEVDRTPREMYVVADEFKEFIGTANLDFCTTLGNLWDWDDEARPFESRLKNSKSVAIWQPYITILGGITPDDYIKAFPPAIIGAGFLSRMLHIHGERSGRSITFPEKPADSKTQELVRMFCEVRKILGAATITSEARAILEPIYKDWVDLDDIRFKTYSNRRFTELLKLLLVTSASHFSSTITEDTVIEANTYLTAAEFLMPKALGEFGKSKNSDVADKVMRILADVRPARPISTKEIWKLVHKDLEKITDLAPIMQGLQTAEKVHYVPQKGWLTLRKVQAEHKYVDWKYLTEEERRSV